MRGTALARTLEAQGAKCPLRVPPPGDRGLQLGPSTAASSRLPRVARNLDSIPVFQCWQQIHSNNHKAWANLTGKVQPTDYRFSTSVWEEAEPSKDMRRPGRGRKMRRQHAGRNKDIQSQLRRNSQASTGTGITKGQHFKMKRVKEWSAGKGELETVTSGFQNWNP